MPTIHMSDALREAYAVADSSVIEYYCFEFSHPDWVDDEDNPQSAYIVHGHDEIVARLEADAEGGRGGELITWNPLPLEFSLPPTTADEVPTFQFKFFDPTRIVIQKIFQAQNDPKPIKMYTRVYLSNRLTLGPETIPVPRYYVGQVNIQAMTSQITGRCVFQDYMGRSAPFRTYTLAEFPGLRRR